ncbi:hypothetical protein DPMN_057034 [Dreissena polymorpha]|uniref:Uncharacterized protein n=1 Tax=Dreissena polymorpha TaxID=45954 RepID=A0A9D4CSU9_DREPO|nr:hypothetical protein DPMN_057034 [Dreissena polymorpha]
MLSCDARNLSAQKNAPPLGSHVFQAKVTIFKLIQDIIATNLLTKFHEDRKINVASRVLTRKKCPAPWRPYIIGMNLLTKFHFILALHSHIKKNAPPPGGHVFSPIWTVFFHEDWAQIVTSRVFTRNTAPPPGGHVFQRTGTIFILNQHIIHTNILTKLHQDWASNVTSAVFANFELSRGINGTNVLTKFDEDRTMKVASRVFTRQNVDDGRRTTDKRRSQKLTVSTLCSGELKIN